MKQRHLGKAGPLVSIVGLGCNNFGMRIDLEQSRVVIHKALDLGITLFDTADIYGSFGGSETILGQVLGSRRKDIILATKFGKPMGDEPTTGGASHGYIISAVEASLRRLRTDWIDLYQVHVPDPLTPIEETLRTLDDLIHQGKVRFIGCSNYSAPQLSEAQKVAGELGLHCFVSCQDEYSLLTHSIERELIPAMNTCGLGLLPYFPLAGGLLTGKYKRDESVPEGSRFAAWKALAQRYLTESNWKVVERLQAFCEEQGYSLLELAFGWLLSKPIVSSVIAGATKPAQVKVNIAAADMALSPEELKEIDRLIA